MCDWCEKYGGGYERWYFNPANYARRLYKIRREEAEASGAETNPQAAGGMAVIGRDFQEARDQGDLEKMQEIKQQAEAASWITHFGQVITLEEALKISDMIYPIGLMTCVCRRSMQGYADEENFVCMGMGPGMYKWERWPDTYRGGMHYVTPDEAKEVITKMNKRGLVQTVFTFGTPYLAGLCNCDYPDCAFVRTAVDFGIKLLWKGHYVAKIDPELCTGCARCVSRCQFKALNYSPSRNMAFIDQFQCFGCGLCVTECDQGAISLVERAKLPALANVW